LEYSIPESSTTTSDTNGPNEDLIGSHLGTTPHLCTWKPYKVLLGIIQTNCTMKQFEYLMKQMQMHCLTDAQWTIFKTILNCHRDGFTNCQSSKLSDLLSEIRLNDGQFSIFTNMLNTSKQKTVLLRAGGGTGKTFISRKFFEE
jgi:hypothetical protein